MKQNSQRISLAAKEELAGIARYIITLLLITREPKVVDLKKHIKDKYLHRKVKYTIL